MIINDSWFIECWQTHCMMMWCDDWWWSIWSMVNDNDNDDDLVMIDDIIISVPVGDDQWGLNYDEIQW